MPLAQPKRTHYTRFAEALLGNKAGGLSTVSPDESPDDRATTALRRLVLEVLGSSLTDRQKLDKIRGLMNEGDTATENRPMDGPTPIVAAVKREQWERNFGRTLHINEQLPPATGNISESITERIDRLSAGVAALRHRSYPAERRDFVRQLRRS